MSRSFVLPPRIALAALLVLCDYLSGFGPTAETRDRVDALLRPLRDKDRLLLPALRLGERITELAVSFPEAMQVQAAHLTHLPPVPC